MTTTSSASGALIEPLWRSRAAVIVLFLIAGGVSGSWAGRIPTVRAQVGLDDARWGLVLTAQPAGTLLALLVVTWVITRSGARRLALPGAALLLAIAPLTTAQSSVPALVGCLFVQGLASGLLFGPMNSLAVKVEKAYRRSIMSSFHGWFSIGQLLGSAAGVAAGTLGLSPWVQLSITSAVLAGALLGFARYTPRHSPPGPGNGEQTGWARRRKARRRKARRRKAPLDSQLLLLVAITLLAAITEGSALQWSAQFAVALGASVALGALTLTVFTLCLTLARLIGDRLNDKFGPKRFVQLSVLVAATGATVAVLGGSVPTTFVGFALLGAGSGCVVPTVIGLAGRLNTTDPGRAVAIVNIGEWPAFFIGPPAIGFLAQAVGLRYALLLLLLSTLLIFTLTFLTLPRNPDS